ncbi:MAG: hypothetical protein JRJ49_10480 [Deltaproteobacteria bacterium]|nr:hypothetical protein [Deltaproteobacteria bacterium]
MNCQQTLILDEATSSLDSAAESSIQKAIFSLKKQNKTVIIIAHRLSTVMNADKIIVLKQGETVEEGTHKNLLAKKDEYYSLWQYQIPLPLT